MKKSLSRVGRGFTAIVVVGLAVSLLPQGASADVSAEASAPPSRITVDVETVNGSGCPAGTTSVDVAPDNTSFEVNYSNYRAEVGDGAKPTDFRKNCQLNLALRIPAGFTFAIAEADYSGYAHLRSGATGLQKASYYFQGSSSTASISHEFTGPLRGVWHVSDVAAALIYSPCGGERNLNINTQLRVYSGTSDPSATSFMAMDSTDGSVRTIYHLAWKRC